jgi:DNA repair exonuclease SbcCD ATPase subunit
MNCNFSFWRLKILLASLLAAGLVCGCKTTSHDRSAAAAVSLQAASAEVQAESQALDATISALDDLVQRPVGDLRMQFRAYGASLNRFIGAVNRTETTGGKMREKNAAYMKAWDEQLALMTFEHIRQSSEARKAEVSGQLEQLDTRYAETHTAVEPLAAYLEDIRRALDADLTLAGLEAVKPIVTNAGENATKVRTALAKLSEELSNSSNRMSSIVAQSAPAQPEPALAGRP